MVSKSWFFDVKLCGAVAVVLLFWHFPVQAQTPVPDDNGIAWSFHPSADGATQQVTFVAPPGVWMSLQKSLNLTDWSEDFGIYALGRTICGYCARKS